jgi:hypothetical protein
MEDLKKKVEKKLRDLGQLGDGKELLLDRYGATGVRASIVRKESGRRSTQVVTATCGALSGSMRDRVNGIVGALLNPLELRS